jgi:hypothetical protein
LTLYAGDVNQFVRLIQLRDRNTLSQEDVEEGDIDDDDDDE